MDKNVARIIAQRLRDLRRVRGRHFNLVEEYEAEFRGAISVLWQTGLINRDEWSRLYDAACKFAMSAQGYSWSRIKEHYRPAPVSSTNSEKVVQDEPEQVSAPAAPVQLRVFCVLGSGRFQRTENRIGLNYCVIEYDGFKVDRTDFPRLGKHWSPASVLVGYQERKGHAVCRA